MAGPPARASRYELSLNPSRSARSPRYQYARFARANEGGGSPLGSDAAERRAKISVRFAAKHPESRWGGWLPLPASQRQCGAVTQHELGATTMEITTVGLDLAKNVFQGSRDRQHRRSGRPALSKTGSGDPVLQQAPAVSHRHGGVRHEPSLGARAGRSRSRGAADAAGLRQALREAGQD